MVNVVILLVITSCCQLSEALVTTSWDFGQFWYENMSHLSFFATILRQMHNMTGDVVEKGQKTFFISAVLSEAGLLSYLEWYSQLCMLQIRRCSRFCPVTSDSELVFWNRLMSMIWLITPVKRMFIPMFTPAKTTWSHPHIWRFDSLFVYTAVLIGELLWFLCLDSWKAQLLRSSSPT